MLFCLTWPMVNPSGKKVIFKIGIVRVLVTLSCYCACVELQSKTLGGKKRKLFSQGPWVSWIWLGFGENAEIYKFGQGSKKLFLARAPGFLEVGGQKTIFGARVPWFLKVNKNLKKTARSAAPRRHAVSVGAHSAIIFQPNTPCYHQNPMKNL